MIHSTKCGRLIQHALALSRGVLAPNRSQCHISYRQNAVRPSYLFHLDRVQARVGIRVRVRVRVRVWVRVRVRVRVRVKG